MGPLKGKRVIELQSIGPGPFCGMMLADMGAEIIRVDRSSNVGRKADANDILARGRKSVAVDLKNADGVEIVLKLIESADVLIEGFRPGVMERLGLGPDVCHDRNPKLVYGRMTGWGQFGEISKAAGHDINYIALSGALHAIGPKDANPTPPLNLVGDFGGGGMMLAFGIASALVEAAQSGKGQVVDAAMTDGSAVLMNAIFGIMNRGGWSHDRGTNLLDGGAHFYGTYETADGKHISIGSIEPQFYALLMEKTGLDGDPEFKAQMARNEWPQLRAKLAAVIVTKSRDDWDKIMYGTDICYAPVLNFEEAVANKHNQDRATFVEQDGVIQAAPAPRFSRTAPLLPGSAVAPGQQTDEVLSALGMSATEVAELKRSGAIA